MKTVWITLFVLFGLALAFKMGEKTAKSQVYVPEPVLSKCDSIIFANDSIARENHILANRILTYKLGLEQLKMVNKDAADYLINSGNFKFTDRW